jgi:hypothetical protein
MGLEINRNTRKLARYPDYQKTKRKGLKSYKKFVTFETPYYHFYLSFLLLKHASPG